MSSPFMSYLNNLRKEHTGRQRNSSNFKAQIEKANQEVEKAQKTVSMYYELHLGTAMELAKYSEQFHNLYAALIEVAPHLPDGKKEVATNALEAAKQFLEKQTHSYQATVSGEEEVAVPEAQEPPQEVKQEEEEVEESRENTDGEDGPEMDLYGNLSFITRGSYRVLLNNSLVPTEFSLDSLASPAHPRRLVSSYELNHGSPISAVTFAPDSSRIFTGSEGSVKIWANSKESEEPRVALRTVRVPGKEYVKSMKIVGDDLIVASQTSSILVWNMERHASKFRLNCKARAVHSLCLTPDHRLLISSDSDGYIKVFDLHNRKQIGQARAHGTDAMAVDLSRYSTKIWSAGLDAYVTLWDIRMPGRAEEAILFDSPLYRLACSPTSDWVSVAQKNGRIDLFNSDTSERYSLSHHAASPFAVMYAHSGEWCLSVGSDNLVQAWGVPKGLALCQIQDDRRPPLTASISHDDSMIVTATIDGALVYNVEYE